MSKRKHDPGSNRLVTKWPRSPSKEVQMEVTSSRSSVVTLRRSNRLKTYQVTNGLSTEVLADRLMLRVARVSALLDGRAEIGNELATHLEEMLELPPSWLDRNNQLQAGPENEELAQSIVQGALPDEMKRELLAQSKDSLPKVEDKVMSSTDEDLHNTYRTAGRAPIFSGREHVGENRRNNLVMLTTERGTKNRLAQLAGTSGSRISLMTSARKPVSDVFAHAIEDGLKLTRGWLDIAHTPTAVPGHVWDALQTEGNTKVASTPVTAMKPPASSPPLPLHAPSAAERSSEDHVTVQTASIVDRILKPAKPKAQAVNFNGVFDKTPGEVGPIAEALAKTVLHLSQSDILTERQAFLLLGTLVSETSERS